MIDSEPPLTLEDILVPAPEPEARLDPQGLFRTPGRFELEIGCGKGRFLLHRARTRPDVRILGIEWANKICRYAADRVRRHGLRNARLLRTDADLFVRTNLPPGCMDVLHLYHPDPWPKKRHHKRRLVQDPFAAAVIDVLRPGGLWMIQTDHAGYFEHIREVVRRFSALEEVPFEDEFDVETDWEGTNFEVKYRREGRPIYRLALLRSSP